MKKDLFRILIIVVNFSQIGTSLPSVFNVKWPTNYIRLLDNLNVFNINVLELTGASCATKIDHAAKLTAMACFPLVLVLFALIKICVFNVRSKGRIKRASDTKHAILWKNAVEQAFDVVDHDGNEIADPDEMCELFQHMGVKLTEKEAVDRMRKWTNNAYATSVSRKDFVAILAADADKHELITRAQQDQAIAWTDTYVTISQSLSGVGELMFAIHAPVSQAAFEWFWFVKLGDRSVLRVDPNILYRDEEWNRMLPIAGFVLIILTLGLPLYLAIYLFYHRNELDSVGVLSRFGWSYDRYTSGIEWWGIHEILRKAILTGMLIFVPSVSLRVSVALIVSIVAVVNLNYFEPFKNKIVFWVSEVAFVMTSVKYVTAMLRLSTPEENSNLEERTELVGTFLIAVDIASFVMFFIGGLLCIVWLAKAVDTDLHNEEGEDTDDSTMAIAKRKSVARRRASKSLRKHSLSVVSMKKAVVHDKVVRFEKFHEEQHIANIAALDARAVKAKDRMKARLRERHHKKKKSTTKIVAVNGVKEQESITSTTKIVAVNEAKERKSIKSWGNND